MDGVGGQPQARRGLARGGAAPGSRGARPGLCRTARSRRGGSAGSAVMSADAIPVSVLTGFLGSGKTTMLRHLLRQPEFSRTAVIINEFGEVGLDHELVEASTDSFVQLQTGCLCCKVRSDLVETLADVLRRRDCGEVSPFTR